MKHLNHLLAGCGLMLAAGLSAAEGICEFDYPDAKIIAVQDREARFPRSLFSPSGNARDNAPAAESYAGSINVFLIVSKTTGAVALIDAGNGEDAGGALLPKLKQLKIDPRRVKAVFITHIHPDHVGGLARRSPRGKGSLAAVFPEAVIYVSKTEYESCRKTRNRLEAFLRPYAPDRLKLFDWGQELKGDFGVMIPHDAAGHTPGHTIFEKIILPAKTAAAPEKVFFVGDILHALDLQVTYFSYCARYDQDPVRAAAARNRAFLTCRGFWFGAHFPFPGKIAIVKKNYPDGREEFSYIKAE